MANSAIVDGIYVNRAQLKKAQKTYRNRPDGLPAFWQKALDLMGPEPVKVARPKPKRRRRKQDTGPAFSEDYLAQVKADRGLTGKERRRQRRVAKKRPRHGDA